MSQFAGDEAKARSAAVLYLTGPGTPFIYYGEEIGMTGAKPDEKIRTPMQWSAEANAGFTLRDAVDRRQRGLPAEKRRRAVGRPGLAVVAVSPVDRAAQRSTPRCALATTTLVDASQKPVYAALRATEDEAVLVLLNLGDQPVADYKLKLAGKPVARPLTPVPLLGEGDFAHSTSMPAEVSPITSRCLS